jgi:hypothetical protein
MFSLSTAFVMEYPDKCKFRDTIKGTLCITVFPRHENLNFRDGYCFKNENVTL